MDLGTAALVVAVVTPLLTAGAAWGAVTARLRGVEHRIASTEREIVRAHSRVDDLFDRARNLAR